MTVLPITYDAQLFIDGKFTDAASGKTMDIVNPATGAVIGRLADAGANDVDRAVSAAQSAFEEGKWSRASNQERARVLNRFADLFEADLEAFYKLETLNNGRPIVETRAQISRLPQFYRYFAALALTRRSDVIPVEGPYLCYTQRAPLGVVALMTSFNHPLMILSKSLAPALATGNSVVIKPSEQTPLTTIRLVELLDRAGVPKGVVNVVNGAGAESGAALASHPKIRKVTFTGSTEVGRSIGAATARNFAAATLELGGKGAVIIFDDMDMERAVNGAAFAAFIAAGQTCVVRFAHPRSALDVRALPGALSNQSRVDPSWRSGRRAHAARTGHFRKIKAAHPGDARPRHSRGREAADGWQGGFRQSTCWIFYRADGALRCQSSFRDRARGSFRPSDRGHAVRRRSRRDTNSQ